VSSAAPVSGVVICRNEETSIARCLESLSFCDEIVVVDSHSTDRTREIARRYTARVIEHPFEGYVKQKNFALEQATHDWIVSLDADEALSPELAEEIQRELAANDGSVAGYELDRVTWYLGVWQDRGDWHPDWKLRVFRRSLGRWVGRDPHDSVELRGPVKRLRHRLEHYNYRDLSEHIQRVDHFSSWQAQAMHAEGVRFRRIDLLLRPLYRFFKGYVLRGGFLKGLPGLLVSVSSAYYVFMKYAKLWELERGRRAPPERRR
jgi:glycosyltransferase involved in cell wall biosynthesis